MKITDYGLNEVRVLSSALQISTQFSEESILRVSLFREALFFTISQKCKNNKVVVDVLI